MIEEEAGHWYYGFRCPINGKMTPLEIDYFSGREESRKFPKGPVHIPAEDSGCGHNHSLTTTDLVRYCAAYP
jgi:hypothetical protein